MDKKRIMEALVGIVEKQIAETQRSLEKMRDRARDAPGSNVSHSDTSKFQLSNEALGLDGQIGKLNEILAYFHNMSLDSTTRGKEGALVTLVAQHSGERTIYFLVVKGGGERVCIEESGVTTLSLMAPLGRACRGVGAGDEVECNNKVYNVESVL